MSPAIPAPTTSTGSSNAGAAVRDAPRTAGAHASIAASPATALAPATKSRRVSAARDAARVASA